MTLGAAPFLVAVLGMALTLAGCARAPEARLLEVSGFGPARVERGALLRVTGSGFPSGRDARLRLEGVVRRPAESARVVGVTLAARAVSPERVEARVDEALLARLGGGGTFRGRVEVAFDAAVPDAEPVTGAREDVVVLFVAPTAVRLSSELAHAHAATELLAFLGARSGPDADTDGVRLERVDEASRAATAGLRDGDLVIESEGTIVTSLGDLAAPPGARSVQWRVARAGESAPLGFTLPLRGLGGEPDPEWSWAAALVALAWLGVLLRIAPSARLVGAAHRVLCAAARARATRKDFVVALIAGLVAALVAVVPLPGGVDVVTLFGGLFALRLVSAARGGRSGRRARLVRALTLELAAGLALAAIVANAGTARFAGLASAQSLAPLTLGALAGPVPLVAALLWLRIACLPEALASSGAEPLFDGESARRSLATALLALVAFGGASSAPQGAHHVLGALLLGPMALLLSLLASRLRGLGAAPLLPMLALAAGTLVAALALAAMPPSVAIETMLSRACVALVFGTLLVAGASLWRQPRPAELRAVELG